MKPTLWVFSRPLCSECQTLAEELKQHFLSIRVRKIDGQYLSGESGLPRDQLGYILGDVLAVMSAAQVQACNEFMAWPPVLPVGVFQDTGKTSVGFGKERILALLDEAKSA